MTTTFKAIMTRFIIIMDGAWLVIMFAIGLIFGKSILWSSLYAISVVAGGMALALLLLPILNAILRRFGK